MSDRMTAVLLSHITSLHQAWVCVCWKSLFGNTKVRILFLNYSTTCKALCMSLVLQNWFCPLSQFLQTMSTHILIMIHMFLIQVVTGIAFCNCFFVLENIWRTFSSLKNSFSLLEIPLAKSMSIAIAMLCLTVLQKEGEKKPSVSQCTAQEIVRWKKLLKPISELM